ncbi:MAG: hypothetical protein ACFFCW_04220 [Candidatus Hodarchaeota archaeon]
MKRFVPIANSDLSRRAAQPSAGGEAQTAARPTAEPLKEPPMDMPDRYLYLDFQIDTNRINSKANLSSMNILERWDQEGVIHIDMAEVAQEEATKGRDSNRSRKAYGYIATETLASTADEALLLKKIESILFPVGAANRNERNDVEIVFNAHKYGSILVTDDGGSRRQKGGILGNRKNLAKLGIRIMRDREAVDFIIKKIQERDERAKRIAIEFGKELPEWVGKDLDVLQGQVTKDGH